MKITFLGTSAGEEYPGIWCDCENCAKARALGGRNIRRNSCLAIDDDVMIDIGKTAHIQAERFGFNMRKIRTLLVTHSHLDHFDLHTLWARRLTPGCDSLSDAEKKSASSPRFTAAPRLAMLGNAQVFEKLSGYVDLDACGIDFTLAKPFQEYHFNDLSVYTLEGNHKDDDGRSLNFMISHGGLKFLYLADTGWPLDQTFDALRRHKYDFIITEGTFGFGVDSEYHMRLEKNIRLLRYFNENMLWKNKPAYYLTHIAPHWTPPHDEYAAIVEEAGMILAYDGLTVEF